MQVLAIIGMIIIIIVSVIAILAFLLLVVPIRYKFAGSGRYIPEEATEYDINAKIYSIFHIIHFVILANSEGVKYSLRIFGFEILGSNKVKNKNQKSKKKNKPVQAEKVQSQTNYGKLANNKENRDSDLNKKDEAVENNEKKENGFKKVSRIIKGFIAMIKDEDNKATIKLLKNEIIRLLREIKPKRFKANICYGTGDPALTGKILGYISIAFGVIGHSCMVLPDFDNKLFKGDADIRGNFKVFVFIGIALRLLKDKNIAKLIKEAKNNM